MSCRTPRKPSSPSLPGAGLALLLAVPLAAVLGCGKANPVAPSGSTITLSANPSAINSPTGSSTITAVVRKPNGTVAAGVDVRFTTSLGTINVLVQTDRSGIATATLRGDGHTGTATVNAMVDGGATATALMVPIGGGGHTITLQGIPASIPATGGNVKLVALVRDAQGLPAAGAEVNFSTNLGRLASGGGLVPTDSGGEATDTLIVKSTDVGNQTSITVGAQTAAPDGSLQSATFTVSILTNAAASVVLSVNPTQFTTAGGTAHLTALVRNSSGSPVPGAGVNFTDTCPNSTLASGGGIQTADANGQATDTLTIGSQSSGGTTCTVQAFTPGAGSNLIGSNIVTISFTSQ
jgi:Invasin, domain 3